ncbi:MAG TPA: hypothetical protein VGP73_09485 [Thermoanaerobaculia bacterium]
MRKKILFLTLALALTGAAAGLFSPSSAEAACPRVCCPSGGCFYCCGLPCDCAP